MDQYTHDWHGPQGVIPVKIQGRRGQQVVVRARDPYDPGEVEFLVHESELVQRGLPQPKPFLKKVLA